MKNLFRIKIKFEGVNIHNINADDDEDAEKQLRGFFSKFK